MVGFVWDGGRALAAQGRAADLAAQAARAGADAISPQSLHTGDAADLRVPRDSGEDLGESDHLFRSLSNAASASSEQKAGFSSSGFAAFAGSSPSGVVVVVVVGGRVVAVDGSSGGGSLPWSVAA